MKHFWSASLTILVLVTVSNGHSAAPEKTPLAIGIVAEMRTETYGEKIESTYGGKLYAKNQQLRIDRKLPGLNESILLDNQTKKLTVLIHDRKTYYETIWQDDGSSPMWSALFEKSAAENPIGERVVEGHPCHKMKVTHAGDHPSDTFEICRSKDFSGLPLQTIVQKASGEKVVTTLFGLEVRDLHDSLFRVPDDYVTGSRVEVGK